MLSNIFIPLATRPVPVTPQIASDLLRLAATFATHATLVPIEEDAPTALQGLQGALMGMAGVGAEIERASRDASAKLAALGDSAPAGLQVVIRPLRVPFGAANASVAKIARCHDLTMIAFTNAEAGAAMAEAALFGTGRPTMLVPATVPAGERPFAKIAVAWDGSGTASRALHDAMPLVIAADEVIIINAPVDKAINADDASDLSDYLTRQGVTPRFVVADIDLFDIGLALQHRARAEGAGLLIMGAYGHSRMQQFILGGATRGVLSNLQLPVLMSHS